MPFFHLVILMFRAKGKPMKPVLLPFDVAMTLGCGDVLMFGDVPRLILDGPKDNPPPKVKITGKNPAIHFTFSIHRRSWTGRAYTVQLWNEIKRLARVPDKRLSHKSLCDLETQLLRDMGFDIKKEMKREIREAMRLQEAFKDCRDYPKNNRSIRFLQACLKRSTR